MRTVCTVGLTVPQVVRSDDERRRGLWWSQSLLCLIQNAHFLNNQKLSMSWMSEQLLHLHVPLLPWTHLLITSSDIQYQFLIPVSIMLVRILWTADILLYLYQQEWKNVTRISALSWCSMFMAVTVYSLLTGRHLNFLTFSCWLAQDC